MSDDFGKIEAIAGALLRNLAPAQRRSLLRRVATEVRKSQSARIGRQQSPDGQPYAPRRAQQGNTGKLRRKGTIKRAAMFRKLRMAKHLKTGATDAEAWIGFTGRAGRIATIHQRGLADRPSARAKPVRYAKRELLGLTEAERSRALDMLLEAVTTAL